MLNRNGKKKSESITVNLQEDPQLSESEVIAKVERALREKKLRLNKTKNLLNNNSFLKDDENNSFNRELQMLTMSKSKDHHKMSSKTHKKEDPYPLDYQTYKRNLDSKRRENLFMDNNKDSLSIRVDDSQIDHFKTEEKKNNYNMVQQSQFPLIRYKNSFYDLNSKNNPWVKYEYTHPGTFVRIIFFRYFRLNLFIGKRLIV